MTMTTATTSSLWALLAGIAAGAASALYFAYNYHPVLLNGTIHAAIFASGLAAMYYYYHYHSSDVAKRELTTRTVVAWYLAGALPVHLAIHFVVIGDLSQLMMGVSHILLNFSSLP